MWLYISSCEIVQFRFKNFITSSINQQNDVAYLEIYDSWHIVFRKINCFLYCNYERIILLFVARFLVTSICSAIYDLQNAQ